MGIRIKKKPAEPAIPSGTYYWSCAGNNFKSAVPATDNIHYHFGVGWIVSDEDFVDLIAPVFLPHGATVTSIEVFGISATGRFYLRRASLPTGTYDLMKFGLFNSAETEISYAVIDNENFCYWLCANPLNENDAVYGAVIIYTL